MRTHDPSHHRWYICGGGHVDIPDQHNPQTQIADLLGGISLMGICTGLCKSPKLLARMAMTSANQKISLQFRISAALIQIITICHLSTMVPVKLHVIR